MAVQLIRKGFLSCLSGSSQAGYLRVQKPEPFLNPVRRVQNLDLSRWAGASKRTPPAHFAVAAGSVFERCRMRPMTLDEVDFTLAVLGGNDLRGVDLSGCRLRETSLVETDLRKAVLRGADLSGARTTGTRLDDADLRGATVDPTLWRTASLTGVRVDVPQAMAFALAYGLRLDA